jgi:ATP-binding cassette subfamily B (MDR/TAP) protein 1
LTNEVSWFDKDENSSGQISARLSADATTVKGAIGDRISLMVQNFSLLLATCIIAFSLQWRMALVVLATFPLQVFAAIVEQMFLKGFSGDVAGAQARASMVAAEAVGNVRTVAAFNAEDKVVNLFSSELEAPMKRGYLRGQVAGIGYGVSQLCLYGSYGLGLWYGAQLVKQGHAHFNNVIRVFMVLIIAAFAIAETLALAPDIMKGGQALASVFFVLDRRTEIDADAPKAAVVDAVTGDIEFKHVAFSYPNRPDVEIFRDLNLKVRAGKSLALVGASGSGKSSVIALLERFYDPTSGRVLVDGMDIRKLNLKSLRRRIALVSQEPALFATTIYENILYGRETATEQEVHAAAMAANAHNFISALPDSYNTQVGDRGVQLSGGQKQRVAIARAVLKDPAILLLDEATSALDAESEKIVQEALDRLMQGRTSVIVAHRLSTIRNADSIAVIQDGTIIEEGTHNELLAKGDGAYAGLVRLQQQRH